MRIENQGTIKSITLPDSWIERHQQTEPLSTRSIRTFQPQADDSLQIRFVYRGRPFSKEVGKLLQSCLALQPHVLNEIQRRDLLPLMAELADSRWFEFTNAQTFDVNGKRVLWVEGRWKNDPFWTGAMFIDAGQQGCVVQQVVCVAALSDYEQNQQLFRRILNSIEWIT